jgi:hypothetical protein
MTTGEIKLTSGKGSMSQRIADRLKPSNEKATAAETTVHGSGPTRVHTSLHHSGQQAAHGGGRDSEGGK